MSDWARRLVEAGKSLLIVLLALSAAYLAAQVFLGSGMGPSVLLSPPTGAAVSTEPAGSLGVARPVRMAVTNPNGRYGVQYDDDAVDELFDDLGSLLGEALDSADLPARTTRSAWEQALQRRSVYYEFPGTTPLSLAAAWLGGSGSVPLLSVETDRLLLAQDKDSECVRLFYVNAADSSYYSCETSVLFQDLLESYIPNGAAFAFLQPDRYDGLDRGTMLLSDPPSPPIYEAASGMDLSSTEIRDVLLNALSFHPQSNAIYPSADGWSVRDGGDTLRLTDKGTVAYHAGDGEARYPIPAGAGRAELVELTGSLVASAMAPYCGSARVYLSDISQSGDVWTLTYSYLLSGAQVQLGSDGWCARFTIYNGQITDYTLRLRRYTATAETVSLLPEYQAMAAMEAMDAGGRKLLLRYYDGGSGPVSPTWIAR